MQRWTDEQLRLAVAANRNISQTLRALGLRPVGRNYDTIRRRIAALGVDTSHWGRLNRVVVDDDELLSAVANSLSVRQCILQLGWKDCRASRERMRSLIRNRGLDTSHFLGNRANSARTFPQFVTPVEQYLKKGGPRITSSDLRLKLLQQGVFEHRCAICQRDTWQGKPIPLELDHINGDRYDNRLENLRLLCPNCHAMTPTYRGRNMGRYCILTT